MVVSELSITGRGALMLKKVILREIALGRSGLLLQRAEFELPCGLPATVRLSMRL